MTPIPKELTVELEADPFYKVCARAGYHDHKCQGKITWEHAIIYAGKQLQKKFAIIPLCEYGHAVNFHQDGGDLKKEINLWIALSRATDEEILSISKVERYAFQKERLIKKYGTWHQDIPMKGYVSKDPNGPKNPFLDKMWYPVTPHLRKRIEEAAEAHRKVEGVRYTPFQMIERMIEEYEIPQKEGVWVPDGLIIMREATESEKIDYSLIGLNK